MKQLSQIKIHNGKSPQAANDLTRHSDYEDKFLITDSFIPMKIYVMPYGTTHLVTRPLMVTLEHLLTHARFGAQWCPQATFVNKFENKLFFNFSIGID